jgi:hypothetical protein
MKRPRAFLHALLILTLPMGAVIRAEDPTKKVDVCVYGATPAGILAAVAAKQEGCSVLVVEPGRWVGGILGAGIKPMQDCAEPKAVGGLTTSRVFSIGKRPDAIRQGFADWLEQEQIPLIYEQRVQRVEKSGATIILLVLELAPPDKNGVPAPTATKKDVATIEAKIFIDASYEGDVMAAAGVKYAVGRESAEAYQEKLAGVGPTTNWTPIDPYVKPGDPKSGLVPFVDADHGLPKGAPDDYTQAYNYRFYVTTDPDKRIAIGKPTNYDAKDFEIVGRFVEHLVGTIKDDPETLMKRLREIFPGWRNSGEYNYKRESLVTMAPLGVSRFYQDGTYEARARVWRQHKDYLAGLHHFLSTDPRVPEAFRTETAALGLDQTMHPDTEGWPNQLYVRLTRRMRGPYVLTLADVWNETKVEDGVGLALYGVDIYPVRRYVVASETGEMGVATEGNMFVGGSKGTGHPYPIPYRAITPMAAECSNLLVPVCFSASYIAYASARMEPVFCVLGESAGVAAAQAIKTATPVQNLDNAKLRSRLLERGQILEWTGPVGRQPRSGGVETGEWNSLDEWTEAKPGWDWLFPFIDKNKDGKISTAEHADFQEYKKQHDDWQKRARAELAK